MNDAVASHPAHLLREVYLSDNVVMCSNGDINAVCFMFTIEDLTDPCTHWAGGMHTMFFIRYTAPDADHRYEFSPIGIVIIPLPLPLLLISLFLLTNVSGVDSG